jgi:protoheme IX farnesyltransferase
MTAAGPWLRLTTLGASGACVLVVAGGSLGLDAGHRVLAATAVPLLLTVVVAAYLEHRRLLPASTIALVAFLATTLLTATVVHVGLAAVALAASAVSSVQAFRSGPMPRGSLRDHLTLTKPRIMSLLLVTGACGMFVGAHGVPPLGRLAITMVGLALACGGASAINHVLDADIDRLMGARTEARPVAAGRVSAPLALEFGLVLTAVSFVLLAGLVDLLTAALALFGNLFYVFIYTRWLKRTTRHNIVIGGAAGAVPPVVGYAAASGNIGIAGALLFAIVFVWTPPHFWALALLIRENYERAGVPMLPVERGERETVRQILAYSFLLVGVTAVPVLTGTLGLVYLFSALLLGGLFFVLAWQLYRATTRRRAGALFHYSLLYLALLFVAMAVDVSL